jgi:hypothetical protein
LLLVQLLCDVTKNPGSPLPASPSLSYCNFAHMMVAWWSMMDDLDCRLTSVFQVATESGRVRACGTCLFLSGSDKLFQSHCSSLCSGFSGFLEPGCRTIPGVSEGELVRAWEQGGGDLRPGPYRAHEKPPTAVVGCAGFNELSFPSFICNSLKIKNLCGARSKQRACGFSVQKQTQAQCGVGRGPGTWS